jgi:PAS domain S-box-containing protein
MIFRIFPKSFKNRIISGFSLLIFMFLGIIAVEEMMGIPGTRIEGKVAMIRAKTLDSLEIVSGLLAHDISGVFKKTRMDVDSLALSPFLRLHLENKANGIDPTVEKEIQGFLKNHIDVHSIQIVDPRNGKVIAGAGFIEGDSYGSGTGLDRETLSNALIPGYQEILTLHHSEKELPHLQIVRQVFSENDPNRIVGVIVGEIDIGKVLMPLITTTVNLFSKEWECVIASRVDGRVTQMRGIGKNDDFKLMTERRVREFKPVWLALSGVDGPYDGLDQSGLNVLAFHRQIRIDSGISLALVIKIDKSVVNKPVWNEIFRLLAFWFAMFVTGTGLCVLFARQISRPINELVSVARRVESGDLSARAALTDQVETVQLASVFNRMVERLQSWNRELADKVRESTGALETLTLRQQAILTAVPDILMEVDENKVYTWANQPGYDFFGDDVIGRDASDYFVGEQKTYEMVQPLYDGREKLVYVESLQRRKDGAERILAWRCKALEGEDSRIIGTLSTARDITDRIEAERQIADSELRYKSLFNHSGTGMVMIDNDGSISLINTIAAKWLGGMPADFEGESLAAVLPSEFAMTLSRIVKRIFESGTGNVMEETYTLPAGVFTFFLIFEPVRDSEGRVTSVQVSGIDISGLKKSEEEKRNLQDQLVQSQKMEAVGRLAGGVAHDFNNMLGVILGHVEVAMEQVAPETELHEDLVEIRKAAERSADLTRQLLAFARKQAVTPKVLDLNETLEGMLKMLRRIIGEDVQLLWKPCTSLWQVKMDPAQLDQILANLCINARDAIQGTGCIEIETCNTDADPAACRNNPGLVTGEYSTIRISDNGCGMDKETMARIFEPFFTTKEVGQGTGLGLSMVYGAVRQNDGCILVDSEPGKGTEFRVFLPRHKGNGEKDKETVGSEKKILGHETILLVEDEATIMNITRRILEKLGYTVLAANSPAEAVKLAENHGRGIDLLITDVIMPGMNGRELSEMVQICHPGIKILYMSGYTADVIASQGVLDSDVHFIHKPFFKKDLAMKIQEVLGHRRRNA